MKRKLSLAFGAFVFGTSIVYGGDYYSGPIRNGEAIPTVGDKELRAEELAIAAEKCFKDVADFLVAQMPNPNPPIERCEFKAQGFDIRYNRYSGEISCFYREDGLSASATLISASPKKIHVLQDGTVVESLGLELTNGLHTYPSSWKDRLDMYLRDFPQLHFDLINTAESYDDYGRPVNPYQAVRNLFLDMPESGQREIPLKNSVSGKDTNVIVDVESYRDCLMTNLQK